MLISSSEIDRDSSFNNLYCEPVGTYKEDRMGRLTAGLE